MKQMTVVTLCGSTKFKQEFKEIEALLTLKGVAVLSLAFFEKSEDIEVTKELAE